MGQRSQIYIRYNVNGKRGENYKGLIARYYGWNYGERMISRARYIIENLQEEYLKYKFSFGTPTTTTQRLLASARPASR